MSEAKEKKEEYFFDDFTENNYRAMLRLAKSKFEFLFLGENKKQSQGILWRHDIDHSIERALQMAKIEAEEDIKSTYFLYLHSEMYSIFEKETLSQIQEILSLGHRIGLHFDITFYAPQNAEDVVDNIEFEKNIIERLLSLNLGYISFHFPQFENHLINWRQESFCGMINTYSQSITDNYEYISDSNGFWRFKRLEDVLKTSTKDLHVLIHPLWWVPTPMSPRARVQLCIDHRAAKMSENYETFTKNNGRLNIT